MKKLRNCIVCDKNFLSNSIGHRQCKKGRYKLDQNDYFIKPTHKICPELKSRNKESI